MSADEVLSFLAVEFSDDFGQQFLLRNADIGINDGVMVALAAVASTSDAEDRTGTTVHGYAEQTVPLYSPSEFVSHFRLSRRAVEVSPFM